MRRPQNPRKDLSAFLAEGDRPLVADPDEDTNEDFRDGVLDDVEKSIRSTNRVKVGESGC